MAREKGASESGLIRKETKMSVTELNFNWHVNTAVESAEEVLSLRAEDAGTYALVHALLAIAEGLKMQTESRLVMATLEEQL